MTKCNVIDLQLIARYHVQMYAYNYRVRNDLFTKRRRRTAGASDHSLYVCSYKFSSVSVAEWPPFGKWLPDRLTICSL